MKKQLWALLLILSLGFTQLWANYIDQYNLEKSYTDKIQSALNGVFGPNLMIARVSVDMGNESWQVIYTEQSKAKVNQKNTNGDKTYILPGYQVIKNIGPDELNRLPFNSKIVKIPANIKKVTVEVIVNKTFPKNKIKTAEALISKIVDFSPTRGDKINFEFEAFSENYGMPATQNVELVGTNDSFLSPQNLLLFLIGIGLIVLTLAYIYFQMNRKASGTNMSAQSAGGATNVNVNPNIEVSGGAADSGPNMNGSDPDLKQYFRFITTENLDKIMSVLERENVSVDEVAMITSFINPSVSAALLSRFAPDVQAEIASQLLNMRQLSRTQLDKLEAQIKNSLECLVGGKRAFHDIFDYVPSGNKKDILTILGQQNPDGYRNFRENVLIFDDLKFLVDDELKTLLSDINLQVLSDSLIGVDKDTFEKVYRNLTPSAKSMVEQFLKLKSKNVSQKRIDMAQNTILKLVLQLEADGKLNIRSKIGGEPTVG